MRIPWHGPPDGAAGYAVPVQIMARSEHAVLALESILAFRDGALLSILVSVRRGAADRTAWDELSEGSLWREAAGGLEISVRFPDGSRASNRRQAWSADASDTPVLSEANSHFGGDDTHLEGHQNLWLWPLPPAAPFVLEIEWPDLGLERVSATLDGEAINRAAEHSRPLWD